MSPTTSLKKLDYIDSLRGLAILGVLVVHCGVYGTNHLSPGFVKLITAGATGVQLFFLASAFTLFLSMQNRFEKERFPIRNFFVRRFFRIAPMYWLGIAYYLFQDGTGPRYWLGDGAGISTANIFSNITFLHGMNPYWINSLVPGGWSIGVEMSFYAILPFLFSKIKSLNGALIFCVCSLMLNGLLHVLMVSYPLIDDIRLWNEYLVFYFPSQLPVFSFGIILYFLVNDAAHESRISGFRMLLLSGLVIVLLCTGRHLFFPQHILFGFAFLLFAFALSRFLLKLIVNPVINHLGKISFSMYLVHFSVLHWLTQFHLIDYNEQPILNYIERFGVVVLITVILATCLYHLIETPFQRAGKRIIAKWEK